MDITDYMLEHDHEQLILGVDPGIGLKAVIAIHDTSLGPALGPPRMAVYPSEEEAIIEALRFSEAQSYKYAAAGIDFGGGRIILMGDPLKEKSEAVVGSLGRMVNLLGGRFIVTGGGAGFSEPDTCLLMQETNHIIGLPTETGGSGEPARATAYGLFLGIRACVRRVFGDENLNGRTVAIQGFGKVGSGLAEHLRGGGARIIVSDINSEASRRAKEEYGAEIVEPESIYDVVCDVFSPCAWRGILNHETVPRLRCKIVAGSANDQFHDRQRDPVALDERGILYAPDYIINAGGFINITSEVGGYKAGEARKKIERIPRVLEHILSIAASKNITPLGAADRFAKERLQKAREAKKK